VCVGVFVYPVAVYIKKIISDRGGYLTHGWFGALY